MAYDSIIGRDELSDLLNRPEYFTEVLQGAISQSAVLSLGTRMPNMTRSATEMNLENAVPTAYFVNGDTGLKKTSSMQWKGKRLVAEELAVIVPMPKSVMDDTDLDMGRLTARIGEAMAVRIDNACLFGTSLPSTWLTDTAGTSRSIVAGATAAGNTVASGSGVDLYDDLLGIEGVFSKVEGDRYRVTGWAAEPLFESRYRHVRADRTSDGAGLPVFVANDGSGIPRLHGIGGLIVDHDGWDEDAALLIAGNRNQLRYAFRQELEVEIFDTGVINDEDGAIIYNLLQQDMIALRAVMRLGVQIANPVHRGAQTEANRYPFAVLTPAGT